jgi:hypothetical protein
MDTFPSVGQPPPVPTCAEPCALCAIAVPKQAVPCAHSLRFGPCRARLLPIIAGPSRPCALCVWADRAGFDVDILKEILFLFYLGLFQIQNLKIHTSLLRAPKIIKPVQLVL